MSSVLTAPGMADAEYFSSAGLSNSGMKHLAVSPLRYWFHCVNPARVVEEPTPEMQIGTALHCAVLQPGLFDQKFAPEVTPEDFPDCLRTLEDIRAWIRDRGHAPKGTRKTDAILTAQAIDPQVQIFDVIERDYLALHDGKKLFKRDDWHRINRMAEALREEPRIQRLLKDGEAEVPMFGRDPETGLALKAKMDFVAPKYILDLKTFSQKRGKPIDKSIADAIYYEGYYRQAYFYDLVRRLARNEPHEHFDFVMAFVESEEPHEVRIKSLRPKSYGGNVNLYWERARIEVRGFIDTCAEYWQHFGDKPWRYAQEIVDLADEEMPQMAY